MPAITRVLCILSLALICTSCGGGGGSSSGGSNPPPPPPPPPPTNQSPTVDAGAEQIVEEGTIVNLSGTATDADGTIVSYKWQQEDGPTVTITDADMANASFVAPVNTGCEALRFGVTVTDNDGATASDTVRVVPYSATAAVPASGPFIRLGAGTVPTDVSTDGSVLVGNGCGAWGAGGFRWTAATGMVLLDPAREFDVTVNAVSADGTVVVGWKRIAYTSDTIEAFRWTSATGIVEIDDLPGGGTSSTGQGVSADGSVVVGRGTSASGREAFRWSSGGGTVGLGDLPGGDFSSLARAVSADGSVVVGYGVVGVMSGQEAFRWTVGTGMVDLGRSPGAMESEAYDVSADGNVIVGGGGFGAVIWTSAGGMLELDVGSTAYAVSGDGSVVVGKVEDEVSGVAYAFIWTQTDGMRSLRDVLIAKGVTGLDDWELRRATSISDDSRWVVGTGINPSGLEEGFIADISAP